MAIISYLGSLAYLVCCVHVRHIWAMDIYEVELAMNEMIAVYYIDCVDGSPYLAIYKIWKMGTVAPEKKVYEIRSKNDYWLCRFQGKDYWNKFEDAENAILDYYGLKHVIKIDLPERSTLVGN